MKETKPNKSTILNRSVDYINHLNYVLKQQEIARVNLLAQIEVLENSMDSIPRACHNHNPKLLRNNHNFNQKMLIIWIKIQVPPLLTEKLPTTIQKIFADIGTSTENI